MGLDTCAYMDLVASHTLVGKVDNHQSDSDEAPDLGGDSQALFCMAYCNVVVESASCAHMGQ